MSAQKEIAISIDNISKSYTINHKKQNNTIRDSIVDMFVPRKNSETSSETYWALKDVSFDVFKGETLGIVGSNGAGKSTLLKVLSKIVHPTSGTFTTNGRVASLLEVGTGFHPELTGRENVYFNGSILGMKRSEIAARFDEIVDFSEIGNFIDTPVKFYSSGMYVRLAFAIAAHLDPEILIIDEALAVGDIAFQQKCIAKMRATAASGNTVLFVTHAMNIVEELCDRAVYLKNGRVTLIGDTSKVVSKYIGTSFESFDIKWENTNSDYRHDPNNPILPISMGVLTENGEVTKKTVTYRNDTFIEIVFEASETTKDISVGVSIFDEMMNRIMRTSPTDVDPEQNMLQKGTNKLRVPIPTNILKEGSYTVALDVDILKKGWVHNPYHTPVRIKFFLRNDGSRPPLWDPEREATIKPVLSWQANR